MQSLKQMTISSLENGAKPSRQQQALARREHLIEVALQLFAQQGYEATSIKQIATSAGVAMGLLYHYFPSKNELMKAIWERHSFLPELRNILLLEGEQATAHVLLKVANGFSALVERKQLLFRIMVRESQTNIEVASHMQSVVGEGVASIATYLETRIAAGELRPHNTALTARTLMGTVLMTHLARLPSRPWEELVAQLIEGIAAS